LVIDTRSTGVRFIRVNENVLFIGLVAGPPEAYALSVALQPISAHIQGMHKGKTHNSFSWSVFDLLKMVSEAGHVVHLRLNDVLHAYAQEHVVQFLFKVLIVALKPDRSGRIRVHLCGFVYNLHQGGGDQIPHRHLFPHLQHRIERRGTPHVGVELGPDVGIGDLARVLEVLKKALLRIRGVGARHQRPGVETGVANHPEVFQETR
jgi:hypothetical protein